MDLPAHIHQELAKAHDARARGNEGQARVCARRAAGAAVRDYLERHQQRVNSPSAYDLLLFVANDSSLPQQLRDHAARLTLRVDDEFRLPPDVDLLADARALCEGLAAQ